MQKKSEEGMTCSNEKGRCLGLIQTYLIDMKLIAIRYRIQLTVVLLYTFLTILFTYPVAFSTNTVAGGGDVFFYLWDFWWFKKAIVSLSTPFWTPYLFYPSGLSLAFSTITPLNALISIPMQSVFGIVITYNLIWLSSFVLAGFGTFLLVEYFTKNSTASFIAGLIFMFSPYHFAHGLGHLSLLSIQWIPFYIFYLFRTIREKSYKNALLAAFFLLLIGLSDNTFLFYSITFTLFLFFFYIITERNALLQMDAIKRITTMILSFSICFFPFIYPLLSELQITNQNSLGLGGFVPLSADIFGFFLPSQLHPFFGNLVTPLYVNITGNIAEYTVYAGYTVLFLSCIAILKVKTREIRFWALSAGLFVILSLGPLLHINGVFMMTIEGIYFAIPLPYSLIMNLPVVSMARAPVRWDIMTMLALSVLAGFGISYLFDKYRNKVLLKRPMNVFLAIVFSSLILFEFLSVPFPMTNTDIPDVYKIIAQQPGDFAIIEIPGFNHADYEYYQTFHEKKTVTGYTHVPEKSWAFIQNNPAVYNLLMLNQDAQKELRPQKDIVDQEGNGVGAMLLGHYNIKYILVHNDYLSIDQLRYIDAIIKKSNGVNSIVFEDSHSSLYEIRNQPASAFPILTDGWSNRQLWDNVPTRWMTDGAKLTIYSPDNKNATLSIHALGFYRNRTLKISTQDSDGITVSVPTRFVTIDEPIALRKGYNTVYFHTDGCERPISHPELNNKDKTCLSIAVQNIAII